MTSHIARLDSLAEAEWLNQTYETCCSLLCDSCDCVRESCMDWRASLNHCSSRHICQSSSLTSEILCFALYVMLSCSIPTVADMCTGDVDVPPFHALEYGSTREVSCRSSNQLSHSSSLLMYPLILLARSSSHPFVRQLALCETEM